MRWRYSMSRSRRRGSAPSSAATSPRAAGSTARPFGVERTLPLPFIRIRIIGSVRARFLDCGQARQALEEEVERAEEHRALWHFDPHPALLAEIRLDRLHHFRREAERGEALGHGGRDAKH